MIFLVLAGILVFAVIFVKYWEVQWRYRPARGCEKSMNVGVVLEAGIFVWPMGRVDIYQESVHLILHRKMIILKDNIETIEPRWYGYRIFHREECVEREIGIIHIAGKQRMISMILKSA